MARHGTARVLLLGLSLLLGGLQQCKAVDGDAYWGPKGLAAGPEFFPAEGSSGSNHTATPGADTGAVTPPGAEPVAFTPPAAAAPAEPPLSLGLHTAAHSWCLAAVLPAALAGQRYGRGAAVKLVLDAALPSALGAAVAVYALPPPSPTFAFRYAAASGVFALAPALALLLIALRRTYGRVQWQRDHTKEKSESPSKGVIGTRYCRGTGNSLYYMSQEDAWFGSSIIQPSSPGEWPYSSAPQDLPLRSHLLRVGS